jgi:hypothetical protein
MELLEIMNREVNSSLFAVSNNKKALLLIAGLFLFTTLSAQNQYRGLIFEDSRYDSLPLPYHYGKTELLPPAFSMKEYLPRIVTQGATNSAASWSAVWYANTIAEAKRRAVTNLDDVHKRLPLSPGYVYRKVQPKPECGEPVSLVDVMQSLQNIGAPRFSDYPEFCPEVLPLKAPPVLHEIPGAVRLFNSYDSRELKVQAIKKALNAGCPVVLGFICPPSFQFAGEFWQPREAEPLREYGGHVVCLFGYDDNKFQGSFEMVNSWGKTWAMGGMSRFRYDDIGNHALYAFQIMDPWLPIEAAITLFASDGTQMPVAKTGDAAFKVTNAYNTGDGFQLSLLTRKGLFSAVIAEDPTGQKGVLFPADSLINPYVPKILWLPSESGSYTLTEPAGTNVLHFIFASRESHLREEINKILKGKPTVKAEPRLIKWAEKSIQFESGQETLVVTVELNQK